MRRVVVTGMGALTPIGNNIKDMWKSVKEGKCGIGPITHYDTTNMKVKYAGELKDFIVTDYIDKKEARKMDLYTQYAVAAAKEAMEDSKLDLDKVNLDRCGVLLSTGIGGLSSVQSASLVGEIKGYDRISPYFIPMTICNMAAGHIAIQYGLKGKCTSVVTACASGTNAIGDAFLHIRDGYGEVMVCGGSEASIVEVGVGGFTSLRALSEADDPNRASIPFDKERNGFVMGEGAGVLVLEEYEHAIKRGAKIYCEVVGYASNCDAYHITAPVEDGSGAAKCMKFAIEDAKINPTDIDYINAHGTSTPLNDKGETKAIKLAFGEHANKLMVSSTKAMTGHLLGASGAVEGIITALSLKEEYVPATINYKVPDEECDLDIVPNQGRNVKINYAMSNSLGFGGHNASIILKRYEA